MTENTFTPRAMRMTELLDAAFRLYRRNFLSLVGIMALVQIPTTFLGLIPGLLAMRGMNISPGLGESPLTFQYFLGLGLGVIAGILGFFLVQGLGTATMVRFVAARYLGNNSSGVVASYQKTLPILAQVILALIVFIVLMVAASVWLVVPCAGWLTGLGILSFLGLAVMPLVIPVIVFEGRNGFGAFARAWELARRRFWWFLGLAVVLYLLQLVLSGPSMLLNLALQSAMRSASGMEDIVNLGTLNVVVQTLVGLFVSLLYLPLQLIIIVLAYFDIRIRTEGIDLAIMATAQPDQPFPIENLAQLPVVPAQAKILTWREVGYLVIITLAATLLYVILYAMLFGVMFGFMGLFGAGF